MRLINASLSEEGVEISSRPIRAAVMAMQNLNISAPIAGVSLEPANLPITAMNLASHIHDWYENLYSDRLKVDVRQAKFPILIHGDVFEVSVPLFYGQLLIVSNKNKMEGKNILNTVDMINGFSDTLRSSLTSTDVNALQAYFITCLEAAQLMGKFKSNDFINSALKDSFVSCENLMIRPKSPNLSSWHSVQFAEKIIKFFISGNAIKVKHTHKFQELVEAAKNVGYEDDPRINWQLLSTITPSVRYKPGTVNIKSAVNINIEAWRVAFNVLNQI